MGSQKYPKRGYLDKLANLCIGSGTNAWTDRDHTAFNAVTAGPLGLQRLLPALLDHVLSPTLTEEQFATEIFHVDGEGEHSRPRRIAVPSAMLNRCQPVT
jgi:Zn-dependent M16 (insulinase) family peptidase